MKRHAVPTSRRRFSKSTVAASLAAPVILEGGVQEARNQKLQHACVGVDGIGRHDLDNLRHHPQLRTARARPESFTSPASRRGSARAPITDIVSTPLFRAV